METTERKFEELKMKEQKMYLAVKSVVDKKLTVAQASRKYKVSERQIYRKKKQFLKEGIDAFKHKSRGKKTNKGIKQEYKEWIVKTYKKDYEDFNFHHFHEKLEKLDGYKKVSWSVIYKTLTEAGIKSPRAKRHKRKDNKPPRKRRTKAGALIQTDASIHKWIFEDNNTYALHGAIDDATGIVVAAYLDNEECIFGYQQLLKQILEKYGIPEKFYADNKSVFSSNKKMTDIQKLDYEIEYGKPWTKHTTKFCKILDKIGIDISTTSNPQSKGKIERLWQTFQDRLINEFKFEKIKTKKEANKFIQNVFLPEYNAKFASELDDNINGFIPLDLGNEKTDLNSFLATWEKRKLYHNSYFVIDKQYYAIYLKDEKVNINSSQTFDIFTYLDHTKHFIYKDIVYDLKPICSTQIKQIKDIKKEEQNKVTKSKEKIFSIDKPSTPWREYNPYWLSKNKRKNNLVKTN